MAISTFPATGGGGASFKEKLEIIKSTQAFTVPADVTEIEVILCGGGASGFGSNVTTPTGGGGGGSAFFEILAVTPGTSYTITIGAGGAGTKGGANNGANSTFGTLLTAIGGRATVGNRHPGGAGSGLGGGGGNGEFGDRANGGGGPGFRGFGGGGAGDGTGAAGANGGGNSGFNAFPNSGSGGGGSPKTVTSGSGGSGVAIIKYWSAI